MTIKYLDYPNSESIFGISNLEFLSEQEKYKLIPNKLSDINTDNIVLKIKDKFLNLNDKYLSSSDLLTFFKTVRLNGTNLPSIGRIKECFFLSSTIFYLFIYGIVLFSLYS